MAKKIAAKAVKKPAKKAAVKVAKAKPALEEMNNNSTIEIKTDGAAQNVQAEPATVANTTEVHAEPVQEVSVSAEEKKEETKMAEGNKGIGKAYNPAEFSQPAAEASGGSSKIFLYAGIGVGVLAIIVVGLFFLGGFGRTGESNVTGATVITAQCSDTDGGYNRFTKGVAEGTYYLDYSDGTFMDSCATEEGNKLTEYYCKGDLVVYATEPCAEGMTCQDGVCVTQ